MSIADENYSFLEDIDQLIQDEQKVVREEKSLFNVFDVLKLDSNETRTHSAFIGELLNPLGSHLMGDIFLKLFLEVVEEEQYFSMDGGVNVSLEKAMGKIDYEKLRGGRIDLLITNGSHQSICIENKIYAKLQRLQLERNLNWNRQNNRLLFLTLTKQTSVELSDEFTGKWKQITYEEHIVEWLERCLLRVDLYPMLVETLKQYLKLINRLSGKLTNHKMNDQLTNLIIDNISASRSIAANYERVLADIKIGFQDEVFSKLKERLGIYPDWSVELGNQANAPNAQIWVRPLQYSKPMWFGIETFSGRGNFANRLIKGIISINYKVILEDFNSLFELEGENQKGWWYDFNEIKDQYNYTINFNDEIFVVRVKKEIEYRSKLSDTIVTDFLLYFDQYHQKVLELVK